MIGVEHEELRPASGAGFSDGVTFAFGDADAELYGLARIGVQPDDPATASALAVLFSGSEPIAAVGEGGIEVPEPSWKAIEAAGVRAETLEPLASWRVALEVTGGGFDLRFDALAEPVELTADAAAARASGVEGYEQLCRVEGTATTGGERRDVRCLGQRGHGWGAADWERIELARTVCAWWDDRHALTLTAIRPAGAAAHAEEEMTAFLLDDGGEAPIAVAVAEPRLSTTYDSDGRQRRAGLELWISEEDEMPRRAAGQVACGSSLDLGRLRLDCAFFHWRMEGRDGVGRYDVLRRS